MFTFFRSVGLLAKGLKRDLVAALQSFVENGTVGMHYLSLKVAFSYFQILSALLLDVTSVRHH